MSARIAARSLGIERGRRLLLSGLDLDLAPGRLLWLRGGNGVGKTSLLRVLAGLAPPAEGEVIRSDLLYVGHPNALAGELTLAENLALAAVIEGRAKAGPAAEAALSALDALGLAPQAGLPVRRLSQGQRRRGALARLALDAVPRAWLLDEPHDALDVDAVARLDALLVAHAARGGAVMLTSHQPLDLPGLESIDLARWAVHRKVAA